MNTVSYSNIVLVLCSPGAVIPVDEETNVQMALLQRVGHSSMHWFVVPDLLELCSF